MHAKHFKCHVVKKNDICLYKYNFKIYWGDPWLDNKLGFNCSIINFQKNGKKFKHHFKRLRVWGLVISREGVNTLNIHSILWEPLDFI